MAIPTFDPHTLTRRLRGWSAFGSLLLVGIAVMSGCASRAPRPQPPPSYALAPQDGGVLSALEADLQRRHGPDASGFLLLRRNQDALLWRVALIDSAKHALDLQYYVWFGDAAGQLLMARVVAAANRGVRVRLLFDDLNTLLHDMEHVQLRDATLAGIDRHPNIEIRVFNAWQERTLLGRAAEIVWDFERLNHRMHNKQMVADNRAAIIGGRNIGDEYFGLNRDFNFHDLDLLGVGPVARQASAVFDRYWNSPWVRRIPGRAEAAVESSAADQEAIDRLQSDKRTQALLEGRDGWRNALAALPQRLHAGKSTVHTDAPSRAPGQRNHMPEAMRALLLGAERDVLITNAYVIPDRAFIDDLRGLADRGVKVRLLTNSLASHDVPAVNSHYEGWREALLDAGVELYELHHRPAIQAALVDTPPVAGDFVGLHTKALVIDGRQAFVGSMNLDPRSELLNSEMGVIVESPALAGALAEAMSEDFAPTNSWRVDRDAAGKLRWTSHREVLDRQPARSVWQRVQNLFFKLFPRTLY